MKKELLRNTLTVGIGRVFAQFSALLLIPVYTMFLQPSEYGTGDLIITYAALALPLVTLALEQGAFRLLVDARKDEQKKSLVISFLVKTVAITFTLLTLLSIGIAYLYDIPLISLALLYVASSVGMNICLWLARGLGDNAGYAKGSVFIGVVSLSLSLVMIIWLSMGLVGMVGALAIANFMGVLYYFVRLRLVRYIRLRTSDKRVSKELLSYSLPLVPNGISWWLVNAADRTIIAIFLGVASTGIFAVAVKFPAILVAIFSIFWISWHESASLHIKHKDRDDFFSKVTNTNIILFGSMALLILATLSVVFPFTVGSEFAEAYIYIPILMIGALLHTVATLYGSVYAAKMQTRRILNTTFIAGITSIIITLIFIHLIGLFAATIALVVGYLVMTVYRHYDIQKYVSIKIKWIKVIIFAACAAVSVVLYYLNTPILNIINVIFVCVIATLLNKGIIISTKDLVWEKFSRS